MRSIHPKLFFDESFITLPTKAQLLLLAVGTYSDYANRFPADDLQDVALHCGWAWDQQSWDDLVAAGLIVLADGMATIVFNYGHPRAYVSKWEAIRSAVFERDGYTCQYCGAVSETLHCDHVHPKSKGGSDEMDNLVTACGPCNLSKGNRTLAEWVRHEQ
jgi:hypothetical protein